MCEQFLPHLILLDIYHLLAGVKHPVKSQLRVGGGLHLTHDLGLDIQADLVVLRSLESADRFIWN